MMPSLSRWLRVPRLTGLRMTMALFVAIGADGLQFLFAWLGPAEWLFVDPVIDTVAALLTCWLLGFHVLLLPTYVAKLIPLAEDLPTWSACVVAVIALRKRSQRRERYIVEAPVPNPTSTARPIKTLTEKSNVRDQN